MKSPLDDTVPLECQRMPVGWQKSKRLSTSWPGQSVGDSGSSLRLTTGKIAIKI